MTKRIGIVGFGFIGRHVYEQILGNPDGGLAVAFVHNRSPGRLADVPAHLVLADLGAFAGRARTWSSRSRTRRSRGTTGRAFSGAATTCRCR